MQMFVILWTDGTTRHQSEFVTNNPKHARKVFKQRLDGIFKGKAHVLGVRDFSKRGRFVA